MMDGWMALRKNRKYSPFTLFTAEVFSNNQYALPKKEHKYDYLAKVHSAKFKMKLNDLSSVESKPLQRRLRSQKT